MDNKARECAGRWDRGKEKKGSDEEVSSSVPETLSSKKEVNVGEHTERNVHNEDINNTVKLPTPRRGDEQEGALLSKDRPKYKVFKIETPDSDPKLEIVISFPEERTVCDSSIQARPEAALAKEHAIPLVKLMPDGSRVVVTFPLNPYLAGDGVGRRFCLELPQRVNPESACSYFWRGGLTITAYVRAENKELLVGQE